MKRGKIKKQTFDSSWKQVIETFFPKFMAFFVPGSENDIVKKVLNNEHIDIPLHLLK